MDKKENEGKKNYAIIIAIALIAVLVVAMLCIGCSKKDVNDNVPNNNNENVQTVTSGEVSDRPILVEPLENKPDLEKNTEKDAVGNKINVSPNINKDKMTFDFVDFTNISLKYANGITDFRANVVNNSDTDYPAGIELEITFLDSEGQPIYTTNMLTSSLDAHEESNLQGRFTMDCSYADTFKVEIVK